MPEIYLSALAIIALCTSVGVVVWNRRRTRRVQQSMDRMLDAAIRGDFSEMSFDESLLSKVETKLAGYLSASAVSEKNLKAEKNKIKELIADISHQTKTPIANISLYAQLLEEKDLPEDCISCVTALHNQAEKLNFLIGALIKTSRLESGILSLHSKKNSIQTVLDSVKKQIDTKAAGKNIKIDMDSSAESACFDVKWTTEAIYNIVDNAVKYTPEGGAVTARVTRYDLFCRIDIADTGIGIKEEEQAKIFQRFYRSAQVWEEEGVGIGLYLTRKILSSEGGYVKVSSVLGKGTTFSVFLPRER
ncbi:MAG: HAMP domain-containing sensor histidine kinase [Clostridiaceae bacterium]|nr:HAMP domain-containing sensor histidine kinase [Clostridiaceae bacterium]